VLVAFKDNLIQIRKSVRHSEKSLFIYKITQKCDQFQSHLMFDIDELKAEGNGRFHKDESLKRATGIVVELHLEVPYQLGHTRLDFQIHQSFANTHARTETKWQETKCIDGGLLPSLGIP